MSQRIVCELHPEMACYRGGESGTMWLCPACEIERLKQRIDGFVLSVGRNP